MIIRHELAVCMVFKDEAPYLDEWLTFHSYLGVTMFYLYNDNSSDNFEEVLKPWIEAGRVKLKNSRGRVQRGVIRDCLWRYRWSTKWLAFIDADEFLWSPTGQALPMVLDSFSGAAGVSVRWVLFGASGHKTRPSGGVIDNYTRCLPEDASVELVFKSSLSEHGAKARVTGQHYQGKTVCNPRRVLIQDIHLPRLYFGHVVDEEGRVYTNKEAATEVSRRTYWKQNHAQVLRVNHYWSRSIEELVEKVQKKANGSFNRHVGIDVGLSTKAHLERESQLNVASDSGIQAIWEKARRQRLTFLS
jgi:hypothetical protein